MEKSIDEIIDLLGVGKFTWFVILLAGICYISEASELNLISLIAPQLKCIWHLTSLEESFTSSSVFLGEAIGSMFWGYIGDKHGRKFATVFGTVLAVLFGAINAGVTNFGWFLVIRFFVGFGIGAVACGLCLISEYIPSGSRGKAVVGQAIFYSFGSIYACLIALGLMQISWRYFLLASTIPPFIFVILSYWLPESVRYLQNMNEFDKMYKILNRISVSHDTPLPSISTEKIEKDEQGDVKVLLQKEYLWKMVIMAIFFIAAYYAYYGAVLMNTEFLQLAPGSCWNDANRTMVVVNTTGKKCHELNAADYTQTILVALAELPGVLLPVMIIDTIGRKPYIIPALFGTAICFFLMNICLSAVQRTWVMFIARVLVSGVGQMPVLLAAELFPTTTRSSAIGILLGLTKLSLIGVSFLVQALMHTSLALTTIILGGLCIVSGVLVMFLPETKGNPLASS